MLKGLKKFASKARLLLVAAVATAMAAVPVLAEGQTGTANTAVTSAMTTVANDMIATGNSIIPIALTVVGISMVVLFGIKMFKRIGGRNS